MTVTLLQSGDVEQSRDTARQAAEVLRDGGLIIFPTETVYGVAASAASDKGIARLRQLKLGGRAEAFVVHLAEPEHALAFLHEPHPQAVRAARKLLNGPVTLLIDGQPRPTAKYLATLGLPPHAGDRIYQEGIIGFRCPNHPATQQILETVGEPVVASTASVEGQPLPFTAAAAMDRVGQWVDLAIDGGQCRFSQPSTVVSVETGSNAARAHPRLTIEREGVYDRRYIEQLMKCTILLVCTGNTCRSPMAQAIARQLLSHCLGVPGNELSKAGYEVISAGLCAGSEAPASPNAVKVMRQMNLDLTAHRSQPLTAELIEQADVIYGMTAAHRAGILQLSPAAESKTFRLDDAKDIDDPFGADLTQYEVTAEQIGRALDQRLKEQLGCE